MTNQLAIINGTRGLSVKPSSDGIALNIDTGVPFEDLGIFLTPEQARQLAFFLLDATKPVDRTVPGDDLNSL